jgi:hypothetical protein
MKSYCRSGRSNFGGNSQVKGPPKFAEGDLSKYQLKIRTNMKETLQSIAQSGTDPVEVKNFDENMPRV